MVRKFVYPLMAVAALGLAFSFNGCSCHAEVGDQAKAPEPPPPAPPPAPTPAATPAPEPPPKKVIAVGKASLEGSRVKIPGELEFDVDKATIKESAQSKDILNTLLEFMKQNPNVTKLRVEGHTDNSGTPAHNQKLSQERAEAVGKWLGDHGVDKGRLTTQGFGDTKPFVPNDSAANKALNRRTEFHVAEIDGKPQDATSGGTASNGASDAGAPAATMSATGTAAAVTGAADAGAKKPKK